MTEYCKGCGIALQHTDPKALGYAPKEGTDYCQRCYKIRNYGDVTISMQQGIENNETLDKINGTEGTIFWVADLFDLDSNLISRLNSRLPGRDIVMILTKRDVLPETVSDEKILRYVAGRLKEEGIQVKDIVLAGYLLKNDERSEFILENIEDVLDHYGKGGDVVIMGMANAGKSTLINRLTHKDDLTISRNPGTTLDLVPIAMDGYTLYDTPGLENSHSILSWLSTKDLKNVIPTKPVKPFISQIYEDQSFAVGGLARLDVVCDGKATVVGYFSRNLPIHRGKLANADRLWQQHLNEMLSPSIDETPATMQTYHAPKLKPGQKMDVVIHGLGWFCISGDVKDVYVQVHQGIHVSFRKAMI